MFGEFQSLPVIIGRKRIAIAPFRHRCHVFKNKARHKLPVLKHKGRIVTADFQNAARGRINAKTGIKKPGIVDPEFPKTGRNRRHLRGDTDRNGNRLPRGQNVELVRIENDKPGCRCFDRFKVCIPVESCGLININEPGVAACPIANHRAMLAREADPHTKSTIEIETGFRHRMTKPCVRVQGRNLLVLQAAIACFQPELVETRARAHQN